MAAYPPTFADPGKMTAATTPGPTADHPGQSPYGGVDWTPAAYDIAGMLGSQMLPGYVENQWQQQQIANQTADIKGEEAFQKRTLGQDYGFQQQRFGTEQQGLGLQREQLGQQLGHLGREYGFQQQADVLQGQDIGANIQNILQNYGYAQKGFGIQQGQLNLAHTQARQGLGAAGMLGSTGARGQMEQGFGYQQQQLNLAEQQAKTQEKFQLGQMQRQQKQLGLTEAEQREQYGYSTQQVQNGMRQLDLQQKNLGISEAQANEQYKNALQKLGLDSYMSIDQLKTNIAALAGGGYSPMSGMAGELAKLIPFAGGAFTQPGGK